MKKSSAAILIFLSTMILVSAQQKKEEMLLEALGALSGQNMYLTYLSIGNIADNFGAGVYKTDFAAEITDELSEMIQMTIKKYKEMLASKLIFEEDYNALMKFIDVYETLAEEAAGLKAMIMKNSEENIGRYERGRQQAWKLISEVLGIQQ